MKKTLITAGIGAMLGICGLSFIHPLSKNTTTIIEKSSVVIEKLQTTTFHATGYSINYPYAAMTKSAMPCINKGFFTMGNMNVFTIAVDPVIIPLGSIVYINDLGIGYATDTGDKIKGMKIDIAFSTMKEAMDFGSKDVNVLIIRKGW